MRHLEVKFSPKIVKPQKGIFFHFYDLVILEEYFCGISWKSLGNGC